MTKSWRTHHLDFDHSRRDQNSQSFPRVSSTARRRKTDKRDGVKVARHWSCWMDETLLVFPHFLAIFPTRSHPNTKYPCRPLSLQQSLPSSSKRQSPQSSQKTQYILAVSAIVALSSNSLIDPPSTPPDQSSPRKISRYLDNG